MGMDVSGMNPSSETGEYFRNNVWWWRHLWNYSVLVMTPSEMENYAVCPFDEETIAEISANDA